MFFYFISGSKVEHVLLMYNEAREDRDPSRVAQRGIGGTGTHEEKIEFLRKAP